MDFWAVLGVIAVGIVTLGGVMGALRDLAKLPRAVWRVFGWHGRFWAWFPRAVRAVDVIISIPDRLAANEELLAEHIRTSKPQVELLKQVAENVGLVVEEVKNNGGSSAKDSLHRIEVAVGLPKPKRTPITKPTPIQEQP